MALNTLFAAGLATAGIGQAFSMFGQYQSAKAQQKAANQNAVLARQRAAAKESQYRRDAQRQMATARAKMAARGVLVEGSSSLDVLSDLASQHAERALLIRYGGEVDSINARNRASMYGTKATSSLISGTGQLASTGLLGAYAYGNEFGFGSGTSTSQQSFIDAHNAAPQAYYQAPGTLLA